VTQGEVVSLFPEETTMKLPQDPQIQQAYANLLLEDRLVFEHTYAVQSKGLSMTYLSLLCASHYAYLGRWNVQFAYWFTGGGLLLWMLVDAFRLPGMVNEFNRVVALNALRSSERHSKANDDFYAATFEPSQVKPKWITPSQSEHGPLEPVPTNHAVIELVFQEANSGLSVR
jgi:hypothetical protein